MHYVYLLKLSNNAYYVGQTKDLKLRLAEHNRGKVFSTVKHKPQTLVWYCAFKNKKKALDFEKYLKTASGKAFRNKRFI